MFSLPLLAASITVVDSDNKPVEGVVLGFSSATSIPAKASSDIAIMDQVASQFLPRILAVSKGQWVDFPNSDNIRHHVYSFSAAKPFEIKMFTGSEAEPIQFNKPGIVVLGCNIHDSMIGYIYVSDQETTKMSDSSGYIHLSASDLASAVYDKTNKNLVNASLWHPLLSSTNTKRIDVQVDTSLSEQIITLDMRQSQLEVQQKSNGFSSKFKKAN